MARPINILQFGESGQLASALARLARALSDLRLTTVARDRADFRFPKQVAATVRDVAEVDIVINATSYTAVDKAETDRDVARLVNADSMAELASACKARGIFLVHVSTDYVFDGTKQSAYNEGDKTNPLNWYGQTKRDGEEAVKNILGKHVIVRTTWLYGRHGNNFLKTMLRLGAEREELRVVNDQHGAPTYVDDLAGAILRMAQQLTVNGERDLAGTYHCTNTGTTSWFGFASAIFDAVRAGGGQAPRLTPISTAEYPLPARRPGNSRLDCSKLRDTFGIELRPWEMALEDCMANFDRPVASS
jgi:dTDP-4-dehydrorhamnose reductase